jgi:hypothetical protein
MPHRPALQDGCNKGQRGVMPRFAVPASFGQEAGLRSGDGDGCARQSGAWSGRCRCHVARAAARHRHRRHRSVPICIAMLLTRPGLELLGQDAELAALAGRYNRYKLPVIPRFLVYTALRQYLQGRTIMRPATIVMWLGNAVHLPLSGVLIFGVAGSPALGIQGADPRRIDDVPNPRRRPGRVDTSAPTARGRLAAVVSSLVRPARHPADHALGHPDRAADCL